MWPKLRSGVWEIIKFVVITLVIVLPIRAYVAQPFIVSGTSMSPTFEDKEYLIIDELSYHLREPERGEVVVFRYPKEPKIHFIKRIIGLPGELVTVQDNKVKIETANGEELNLDESYVTEDFTADVLVRLGQTEYFVMGDNRNVSLDSRSWGPLPREMMTGRVFLRLLPPSRANLLPGKIN